MRSPRRLLAVAVTFLVAVCVLAAGLAALTILAIPLVIALELAVLALVTGVATHRRRRRGARRGPPADPHPDGERSVAERPPASDLQWSTGWPAGPRQGAVPAIREDVSGVLSSWGLTGEAGEPTLLVVTELLDNVAEHGRGPARLAVELTGDGVRVEVADGSPDPPRLGRPDPLGARGRGLLLVDGLATRWGWEDEPAGKVVWAVVPTGWSS
jgi:anti-sigma regulatory factor (Ser/Thr protein kinase)